VNECQCQAESCLLCFPYSLSLFHKAQVRRTTSYATCAYIIPASDIIAFIVKHHSQLPTLADCGQSAVAPPLAALANCATNTPLTPLQIIITASQLSPTTTSSHQTIQAQETPPPSSFNTDNDVWQ
jgi:hypothetical protein